MQEKAWYIQKQFHNFFEKPADLCTLGCVYGTIVLVLQILFPFCFIVKNHKKRNWRNELEKEDSSVNLATMFDREQKEEIMELLAQKKSLKKLDLSFNMIYNSELTVIIKYLSGPLKDLETLHLKGTYFGYVEFRSLSEVIMNSTKLENLNFTSSFSMKNTGIMINELLLKSRSLKKLNLQHTSLTKEDIIYISNGLKGNYILKSLNLSENNLDDESAISIAESIKNNCCLQKLKLSKNDIKELGVFHLSQALRENKTLEELDLHQNNLGDGGSMFLSVMLVSNQTLKNLNLSNCNISIEGASNLSESLKLNQVLTHLNLSNNNIGYQGVSDISSLFVYNTIVVDLKIDEKGNGNRRYNTEKIQQGVVRNRKIQEINKVSIQRQEKTRDMIFSFQIFQ